MRLFLFAAASLLIHSLIVLGLETVPNTLFLAKELKQTTGIEVEVVNQPIQDPNEQQIVRSAPAPEDQLADLKEKAKYLSEQTQRVLIETRAQNTGKTQNRIPQPRFLQDALREKSRQIAAADPDDLIHKMTPAQRQARKDLYEVGPSTMGDALPTDLAVGSFTALNTDKFTFYSFFSRVEDLVRFRWETNVNRAAMSHDRNYMAQVVSRKSWVTQIEFLLNPHGDFVRARLLQSSGQIKFDQAPILAFKDAAYFPNPPVEMIRDDGYIHLIYSFQVNFNPGWMANR